MTSVFSVVTVLFAPSNTFKNIPEAGKWRWMPPLLVGSVFSMVIAWAADPVRTAVFFNNLPTEIGETINPRPPQSPGLYMAPVGVLMRYLIQAGFIWLLIQLVNPPVRFSTVFTAVSYACIVLSIGDMLSLSVIHYHGVENVSNPFVLMGLFGIDQMVQEPMGMAMESLLRNISIFAIWHLALMTIGLSELGKLTILKAVFVAFVSWAFPVLLGAATFSFFDRARALTY